MEESHSIFKGTHYPFDSNPFDFEPSELCPDEVKFQGISNMSDLFTPILLQEPLPPATPCKPDSDSIKMFVGQIPLNYDESDLLQLFEPFGKIYELKLLRNPMTKKSKGCCFVTFFTRRAALNAQNALHNIRTLHGMHHPIQMKPSDVESQIDRKLFIGMLPKKYSESDVRTLFSPFGAIEECSVLRNIQKESKGCAFLTYLNRQSAHVAIHSMHHSHVFEGCTSPIVVRFADTYKDKELRKLQLIQFFNQSRFPLEIPNLHQDVLTGLLSPANLFSQPQMHNMSYPIPGVVNNLSLQGPNIVQMSCPRLQSGMFDSGLTTQQFPLNNLASLSKYDMHLLNNIWYQLHEPTGNDILPQTPSENYVLNRVFSVEQLISQNPWDRLLSTNDQKQSEGPEGANLFIYHLPREFDDRHLFELFQPYGQVLSAKVFIDKATQQSKCFGFVSYDNILSASVAIHHLNGYNVNGKKLKVEIKKKKKNANML